VTPWAAPPAVGPAAGGVLPPVAVLVAALVAVLLAGAEAVAGPAGAVPVGAGVAPPALRGAGDRIRAAWVDGRSDATVVPTCAADGACTAVGQDMTSAAPTTRPTAETRRRPSRRDPRPGSADPFRDGMGGARGMCAT
jgi:hypothetical protein